jgi:YVTN family beta-propeller protein
MKRLSIAAFSLLMLAITACEPGPAELGAGSHPETGRLGISADGSTLYVALADHDEVRAISTETGEVINSLPVGGSPHRLTVMSDGRVAVTARYAGTVNVLDANLERIEHRVEVGADPHGVIEADGKLVVAVSAQRELARLDLNDLDRVADRVALEETDPRGLAKGRDGTVFVSHFRASSLTAVDMATGTPSGSVPISMQASNPAFESSQLDSLTVTPDQGEVVVPHQECNNDPVQFGAGGTNLAGTGEMAYYAVGPTGYPAVLPAISRVDADARIHLSDGPGEYDINYPDGRPESEGPAPAVISPADTARIGNNAINLPVAAAIADDGRLELVVNKGSGNVFVRRTRLGPGDRALMAVADTGVGSSDIVLSPDGSTAYVYNEFDYTVTSFKVPTSDTTVASTGRSLSQFSSETTWRADARDIPRLQTETFEVADPDTSSLTPEQQAGRVLFHSVTPNLTNAGAISCASCHPEGREDGTTWHFVEGNRQTPPLWGGLSDTAPLHWDNTFDRGFADINLITVQMRMGGEGLNGAELTELVSYIDQLQPPPAPTMGVDEASVDRGRDLFFSPDTKCTECHYGSHFTDGLAHDVGTGVGYKQGETMTYFATPPLHGLAHTAPYMHTGDVASLRDLVDQYVATDMMGQGSHLSAQDRADLAAFLETL